MFNTKIKGAFFILLIAFLAVSLFSGPIFESGGVEIVEIVELFPADQVPDRSVESSVLTSGFSFTVSNVYFIDENESCKNKKSICFNGNVAADMKIIIAYSPRLDENRFIYLI